MPHQPKTVHVTMQESAPIAFARGPGSSIIGVPTAPNYSNFKIVLDGQDVMHVEEIVSPMIDHDLIPKLLDRLALLEKILQTADTFGTVLVTREHGDQYEVHDPRSFRLEVAP